MWHQPFNWKTRKRKTNLHLFHKKICEIDEERERETSTEKSSIVTTPKQSTPRINCIRERRTFRTRIVNRTYPRATPKHNNKREKSFISSDLQPMLQIVFFAKASFTRNPFVGSNCEFRTKLFFHLTRGGFLRFVYCLAEFNITREIGRWVNFQLPHTNRSRRRLCLIELYIQVYVRSEHCLIILYNWIIKNIENVLFSTKEL